VTRGRPAARTGRVTRSRRTGGDAGISTVEVVILAPIMILFILVLVGFGQLVDGRGAVDSAARDAARAGSIQKDGAVAMDEARRAAAADLTDVCSGPVTVTAKGWEKGGLFTVDVSCEIRGLAMLGLDIPTTVQGHSTSPIDPFRRTV
jgi:Flp pilus assembly protein TadG